MPRGLYNRKISRKPTEHPTIWDVAWAAGIVEGEGCIDVNSLESPRIRVGQKDRWLCDRLRALFGGSVNEQKRSSTGLGTGSSWIWTLHGVRARGFIMSIFTFLSPRRKEKARIAMVYFKPYRGHANGKFEGVFS